MGVVDIVFVGFYFVEPAVVAVEAGGVEVFIRFVVLRETVCG